MIPIALAVVLALAAAPNPKALLSAGKAGVEAIRPEPISAHIKFLASDLLEGRGTGSRGERIATEYIAAQFAALGLDPAGDDGTFFQWVPLRQLTRDESASAFEVLPAAGPAVKLAQPTEFDLTLDNEGGPMDVTAPLVFVGYGVTAPELGHDDLAKREVKGKIALVLYGAPERFPSTARAWHSRSSEKVKRLYALGAAGVMVIWSPQLQAVYPWEHAVRDAKTPRMIVARDGPRERFDVRASLSIAGTERLMQVLGVPGGVKALVAAAETGQAEQLSFPGQVRFAGRGTARALKAPNVVARWRGADPRLREEHVVFSSHHDHLGLGEPVNGDAIYNGAVDNASGVASLIEIARGFAALSRRPARSILFVTVTAEEEGLVGSDYFARQPTVPKERIVADLNVDMVVAERRLNEVVALGEQHSSLRDHVRAASGALKLRMGVDRYPEQALFIRSDQLSFIEQGIPSLFLIAGEADGPKEEAVRSKITGAFLKERYHQPSDEWREEISFEAIAQLSEVAFLTGLSVANDPRRPVWNKGDFFSTVTPAR